MVKRQSKLPSEPYLSKIRSPFTSKMDVENNSPTKTSKLVPKS